MTSAASGDYLVNGDLIFVLYRGAGALARWTLVKGQQQRYAQKTIESLGKESPDAALVSYRDVLFITLWA